MATAFLYYHDLGIELGMDIFTLVFSNSDVPDPNKELYAYFTDWDTNVYTTFSQVPWRDFDIWEVRFEGTISPISTAYWFSGSSSFNNIDVTNLDTSNVTNMKYMFYNCSSLKTLDLSNFNTSNVTDMDYMFHGCRLLTSLDLSSFDTSKVTTMSHMFGSCSALVSLDLSSFNTSNVTNMNRMFLNCTKLTTIYVSDHWSIEAITDSVNMFDSCRSLVGDIPYDSNYEGSTYATYTGGYLTYKKYYPNQAREEYLIQGTTWYDIAESVRGLVGSAEPMSTTKVIATLSNIKRAEEVSF